MRKYSLSIFWSDEDDAFVALSPEFPGLSAVGDNREDALKEAQFAMSTMEDMARERGDNIPSERKLPEHSGQFRIRIPRSLHTALALEAERQGISLNSLVQMYLTQGITEGTCFDNFTRLMQYFQKRQYYNSINIYYMTQQIVNLHASNEVLSYDKKNALVYNTKTTRNEKYYE